MPKLSNEQARERFVQLLTQIVSDEQAVDAPTRHAALIQLLRADLPSDMRFSSHSDLHSAIFTLAQSAPHRPLALALAHQLVNNASDYTRAPEVMRTWLEAYLETTGWEQKEPQIDPTRGGQYGPEDVEARSASHEGATLPAAGCCVPLYSESPRFG